MRNWNCFGEVGSLLQSHRIYLTYEELKPGIEGEPRPAVTWIYLTYEELKHGKNLLIRIVSQGFILPMRNWNYTYILCLCSPMYGIYLTYEELKPFLIVI